MNSKVGLVGLCGTRGKSNGFWWESNKLDLIGHVLNGKQKEYWLWHAGLQEYDVKYIDGMFMATNRDIPFSEDIIGFHLYDVDYCNVIRQNKLKIKIISHLVNHISSGADLKNVDKTYYQKKWNLDA